MPDHPSLLQTYVWQNYDLFPKFPELFKISLVLAKVAGRPAVLGQVAHSKLVKPAEISAVDGVFRLH